MMGAGQSFRDMEPSNGGLIPRVGKELFRRLSSCPTSGPRTSSSIMSSMWTARMWRFTMRTCTISSGARASRTHTRSGGRPASCMFLGTPWHRCERSTFMAISSTEDLERNLVRGSEARQVASTQMNQASSRSHAIFTIYLTMTSTRVTSHPNGSETRSLLCQKLSKIHLVDLAGSERVSNSGVKGKRLREAANINSSLTVLGTVISALVEKQSKRSGRKSSSKRGRRGSASSGTAGTFIPYRAQAYTLLQDSLRGRQSGHDRRRQSASNFFETTTSTLKLVSGRRRSNLQHAKTSSRMRTRRS